MELQLILARMNDHRLSIIKDKVYSRFRGTKQTYFTESQINKMLDELELNKEAFKIIENY